MRGWLGRALTFMAFHGIDVHGGVELSRAKEPGEAQEVARAVWRRAVGAELAATYPVILTFLLLCPLFHLHLLLFCPVYVVDAHQETVVHDLQLGQELNVPLQFFQEVLFTLFSHVQLLPFIEKVIIFECWQVLSLKEQQQGQVRQVNSLSQEEWRVCQEQCAERRGL